MAKTGATKARATVAPQTLYRLLPVIVDDDGQSRFVWSTSKTALSFAILSFLSFRDPASVFARFSTAQIKSSRCIRRELVSVSQVLVITHTSLVCAAHACCSAAFRAICHDHAFALFIVWLTRILRYHFAPRAASAELVANPSFQATCRDAAAVPGLRKSGTSLQR